MGQEFVIRDNQHKDSSFGTVASDFGQSLFHSAVENPVNGVTQLVNEVAGTNIKPLTIVGAPSEPTSTADSYAQKIGGAIGMVIPYFLVSKGIGKVAGGLTETSMAKSLSMTPFLESSVARAGLSGAVYGGIFNPVSADEKNPGWARLRNAAVDGATFATLTGASESLAKMGIFKPTTSALANTFKSVGTTMIAGVPAGIVSAEGQSLLGQGRFAKGSELTQSAMDFVTVGGALAALTHGVGAAENWRANRSGGAGAETVSPGSGEQLNFKPESPTNRMAATDALKPRETVFDIKTPVSDLAGRLTGYQTSTESIPAAKPGALPNFESAKQFRNTSLEYQDTPVRVYSVEGHSTRIVVPEEYAQQLDAVRQYRLGLEGKSTQSNGTALDPDLLHRALPEDYIAHLDTLPNKDLIQKIYLSNEANPMDPYHQKQSSSSNFESQAESLDNGTVTFFKKNVDASLGDELRHEWAHQLRWQNQPESTGFDLATKYEGAKYQPRARANDGPEERWAVLMGEQFVNPKSAEFLRVIQQAPIQSVFLADAVAKTLQSGSLSNVDAAALQARIDHVQNVVKPAVAKQLISDIRSSQSSAKTTDASRLLIRMGQGQLLNQANELTSLDLTREPVGAATLNAIGNNRNITDIKLDGTHVGAGGEGLGFLEKLPLKSVSLSGTQITGSVLSSLERIPTLEAVDLSYTNIGPESGLGSLGRMPNLKKVDVTGTKFTQTSVDWLQQQLPNTKIVY